ncbi:MAG TPA: hypothetical protein VM098_03095 [Phycisphaerae bacterium]|nr:hypothetical protein [Phycisphaerae bacterium]
MRIAVVIISLAAMGVGLVSIRRMEMTARHESLQLNVRKKDLSRKSRGQDIDLGYLTSPAEVTRRVDEMVLRANDKNRPQYCQANDKAGDNEQCQP